MNALLPDLAHAAAKVRDAAAHLSELSKTLYRGESPPVDTHVPSAYLKAMVDLGEGLEAIGELGGEVKDLSTGLVDFPAIRNGRRVYLCWMLGEERVAHWHQLDAGFAGRTAIETDDEFGGEEGLADA